MKKENKIIAVCGLNCSKCDIFEATNNPKIAQQISDWFKEEKDTEVKIENIRCFGCKGDREKHWSPDCWILNCCVDKKELEFCYECEDFPCSKLNEWAKRSNRYTKALEQLSKMKSK